MGGGGTAHYLFIMNYTEEINMPKAVIKGAGYALIHANDMINTHGTTLTGERRSNPDSDLFAAVMNSVQSFEETVAYPANQCYIGNITPEALGEMPQPWYENGVENASRDGKFGEIMPLNEFIGVLRISDSFDLVMIEKAFLADVKEALTAHPLYNDEEIAGMGNGFELSDIKKAVDGHKADPLVYQGNLVGCIKQAHDSDTNLNSHIMFENMVVKASGVVALRNLLGKTGFDPLEIEYVIETSEEACGDMNQRGGGNFAKAIGELCGLDNATGSDTRGFCAGPTHGLINATALVSSGIYKNVVVVAGGATAKLGMNARDHVKKGVPVLENCLGTFAILIGEDDGVSPVVRTDAMGRHKISSGASPQNVTSAIVTDPLDRIGLKITDVDKYSVEMQNPEITKPAGAGDVPTANYKMIAALGVKRGDLDRKDLMNFVKKHGMPGWAPTQGHIPSGVPYIGFGRDAIMNGEITRAMIIGKGSLFLARMTNLFDGVSFIFEANNGEGSAVEGIAREDIRKMIAEAMRNLGNSLVGTEE